MSVSYFSYSPYNGDSDDSIHDNWDYEEGQISKRSPYSPPNYLGLNNGYYLNFGHALYENQKCKSNFSLLIIN